MTVIASQQIQSSIILHACIANEIVDRTVRRLGVHVTAAGFDNEDDMVKGLAATNRSKSQTCFTHGAGIYEYGTIIM